MARSPHFDVSAAVWSDLRHAVMARDGYRCRDCDAPSLIRGEVHHVHPLERGGKSTMDNLVLLCASCHERRHGHTPRAPESDFVLELMR